MNWRSSIKYLHLVFNLKLKKTLKYFKEKTIYILNEYILLSQLGAKLSYWVHMGAMFNSSNSS